MFLCLFLDKSGPTNSPYSAESFEEMFQQMNVSHLEIRDCDHVGKDHGDKDCSMVLEALKSDKLKSLKLLEVKILQKSIISKVFQRCRSLESLQIIDVTCICPLDEVVKGLEDAPNLKFLQINHPEVTMFPMRLFDSLSENCRSFETLILIDSSRSVQDITEKEFPLNSLLNFMDLEKLKIVYILSPQFRPRDIRKLEKKSRLIVEERPYFIGRFNNCNQFNLPMNYQNLVAQPLQRECNPDLNDVSDFF